MMTESMRAELEPPRFEDGKPMLLAGLAARYSSETSSGIPAQWQRFLPQIGTIPGRIGKVAYGACYNSDAAGNLDYMCAVQVAEFSKLGSDWTTLRVPAQRYAVFAHREPVSTIRKTWNTIFNKWLPESGHRLAGGPQLERYSEDFDSRTGVGGIEVWIPIGS